MTDELGLAVRAGQELQEPARQLAAALGRTRLGNELLACLVENIRYRWAPHRAKLIMEAARKIKECGLPPQALDDRVLIAVLEHGGFEADPDMQDRWSALLANAATGCLVPPAYPEILRQIEPVEARFLDRLFDANELCVLGDIPDYTTLQPRHLLNLQRLGLLSHNAVFLPYGLPDRPQEHTDVDMTPLGASLVMACRPPDLSHPLRAATTSAASSLPP